MICCYGRLNAEEPHTGHERTSAGCFASPRTATRDISAPNARPTITFASRRLAQWAHLKRPRTTAPTGQYRLPQYAGSDAGSFSSRSRGSEELSEDEDEAFAAALDS